MQLSRKIHPVTQREARNKEEEEGGGGERNEAKPIDWGSSGLYIALLNEEDCRGYTTVRTAAEHRIGACAQHSPQLQLAPSPNGPFKDHTCNTRCTTGAICFVTSYRHDKRF